MSDVTPQVLRAPKLFWQTRRMDGHRDWPFAFWRELFQNSVDAKARNIEISIRRVLRSGVFDRSSPGGEVVQVVFADDGTGMTEDTIKNVFLEPGRSTKGNGSGMIGGFGTARTLLCFSQDRYEIHTNGLVVEGDGSEYILSSREVAARRASTHGLDRFAANIERFGDRKGCAFVIDIDPNESEYSWRNVNEHQLRRKLLEFLDMSDLKLDSITLDGEKLVAELRKGHARRKLSAPGFPEFGTVHVARDDLKALWKGYAIVRVNGLVMFKERIDLDDAQVVLELDAKRTRQLLTDNRDGLKDAPDMAFRDFVRDLTVNRREALRDKSGDKEWTLEGELGDVPVKPEDIEIVGQSRDLGEPDSGEAPSKRNARPAEENVISSSGSLGKDDAAGKAPGRGEGVPGLHDFHMHAEGIKGNPVLENAARRWQPKYWRKQGESLAGRGRESHELLAAWTAACANALGYVAALRPKLLEGRDVIPFVPGFIISGRDADGGRVGGLHKILPDGRHALLVNPILTDGGIAYDLRRLRDGEGKFGLQTLVHVAIHEACHVIGRSHNDEFANLLTSVSARVDYAKMSREMLEKINSVRTLYGAKEARIQAFEELAALRAALEDGQMIEPTRSGRGRRNRPAEQALAAAYPVGTAVLGALAAPENQALPTNVAREALAQAIAPVTETETAIHAEILGRIDDELAKAARNDWIPPASVDWGGFEQSDAVQAGTTAVPSAQDDLDVDLGGVQVQTTAPSLDPSSPVGDELDLDLGSLPLEPKGTPVEMNLEQLGGNGAQEIAPPPLAGEPPADLAAPGMPGEETTHFPSSLSLNDIIGEDSNSLDGDFRP